MIRVAAKDDVQAIADSYNEVIAYENANNVCYTNWKLGVYPTIAVPKARVSTNTMFVLEDNHEICASMTLDNKQDPGYRVSTGNMKPHLIKSLLFTPYAFVLVCQEKGMAEPWLSLQNNMLKKKVVQL